ncbi:MAG: hypothetical protein J0H15_07345 [Xanthomonadales bacterium]|nr:hypothetical protein [Xanthomonadales bacterium]
MVERPAARRRWPWLVLSGAFAVLLAGGLALRHYTRPATLTALLQAQARTYLDAELAVGSGAQYGFWPRLHVRLPEPSLRATGAASPIITARSLEVALPLASLWSGEYAIERLVLVAPTVDLDALEAWLAARPPTQGANLPNVRFALEVRDARILREGEVVAEAVDVTLASAGDVAAWLEQVRADPTSARLPPLTGSIRAERIRAGELRLEGVEMELRDGAR